MIYIKVKNNFEWFHRWESAPKSEAFLRNEHRHIFYVTTKIGVEGDDRELEYFAIKKEVNSIIESFKKFSDKTESCEMIAEYILDYLEAEFSKNRIEVEVSEDNENGSCVDNSERFK